VNQVGVEIARSGVKIALPLIKGYLLKGTSNFTKLLTVPYYYYYYYILRLSPKRYEELLAIRLGKPLINKNLRRSFFASFLCSPLLINDR
jgi:hypothetical protein